MESNTPRKANLKAQAPKDKELKPKSQSSPRKPLVDLSEKIERVSDAPTKKARRYFKKTTYIKGFGIVNAGDELTGEMLKCWTHNTDVKIDAYVGDKVDVLKELPKSDKEKLAEYEAQNK